MPGFFYKVLLVGTAVFVLAACDNDGGSSGGSIDRGTANTGDGNVNRDDGNRGQGIESNFGAGFATAFTAAANSEPIDPSSEDIIAIDPTADPIDF